MIKSFSTTYIGGELLKKGENQEKTIQLFI